MLRIIAFLGSKSGPRYFAQGARSLHNVNRCTGPEWLVRFFKSKFLFHKDINMRMRVEATIPRCDVDIILSTDGSMRFASAHVHRNALSVGFDSCMVLEQLGLELRIQRVRSRW